MSRDIAANLSELKKALPGSVTLVAVSKTKPDEDILMAYKTGHRDFGENRIQEMTEKHQRLPSDIRWHMIGNVQGNKIKYMAPFVFLVHGMDKPKRFKELSKEAAKNNRVIDCLLQVHIALEESKYGFSYEEARAFMREDLAARYPNVRLRGLMGMATFTDDRDRVRAEFHQLAGFFREMKAELASDAFDILSMGMSGDYEIALEEGANMIRVGQAIFGARK
jgi:hypothetical protein